MSPEPLEVHVPPSPPTHVQAAPVIVAGSMSATVASTAGSGPAFDITIVYVMADAGTAVALASLSVIERSADGTLTVSRRMLDVLPANVEIGRASGRER